ncbi:TPA: threonine--tRNA ligase [Candidatus Woesearchaeota archaeon]|nr:threonine--tRNA ligase [Candidatus Woesearchaeota archaeon]
MRILLLHCDYIKFKPVKKAIKEPEELSEERKKEIVVKDPLVILTAVEKGDNDKILKDMIAAVEKTAGEVKAKKLVLYPYAHLSSNLSAPATALEYLQEAENVLAKKGFEVTRAPFGYYKEFELKCKGHPLSELSKEFRTEEQIAQAGTAKPVVKKQVSTGKIILDRRNLPPNDHRILGEDLGIFHLSDDIGPGLPLWLPNGEIIRNQLMLFMRDLEENKYGYKYVSTPHITKGHLYEKTGHLPYYAETMFPPLNIDGIDYYLKPMNCPHHHMIFSKIVKSYRDLPLRLCEEGDVYRNELSGVTYGLIRVRSMTMNDAHIYVTPEQLKDEFIKVLELFEEVYKIMNIRDYWFRLSLPDFKKNPEKYTGDPKEWDHASKEIEKAMKEWGKKYVLAEGEAAFYGPKIDVQIKNAHGKEETIATSQIDIVVPKRLGLTYVDEKGEKKTPIVIHRAILGTMERFTAFLLEQTNGSLPVWLSPVQVRVINFTDRNNKAAEKVIAQLKKEIPNVRVDSDLRNTTVNDKIRDSEMQKIPYCIVIGDKEEEKGTLAVRKRGEKKPVFGVKIQDFVKEVSEKIEKRN